MGNSDTQLFDQPRQEVVENLDLEPGNAPLQFNARPLPSPAKDRNGRWLTLITIALTAITLGLAVLWYSLHSLNSRLAAIETRVAALPRVPPGVAAHRHPELVAHRHSEAEDLPMLVTGVLELTEQVREQQEILQMLHGQELSGNQAPAAEAQLAKADTSEPAPAPAETTERSAPAKLQEKPGLWQINLGSFHREEQAAGWAQSLVADDYPIEVASALVGETTVYRVRVAHLPDRAEAQRVAEVMAEKHGLEGVWMTRSDPR